VKAKGTLSNKLQQFEALQKEFEALQSTLSKKQQQLKAMQKQEEALQINLRSKQKQFEALQKESEVLQKESEALQKETKDLTAAALKLINIVVPIEPGTAPPSLIDRLRQAPFELRTYCEALAKLCVNHVLALAKSWWLTVTPGLQKDINRAIIYVSGSSHTYIQ